MLRFLLRTIALLALAGAFAAAIVDGTRSIAADGIVFTTLGQAANYLFPAKLTALEEAAAKLNPLLRDPGLTLFLLVPTWALFGAIGGVLLAATRPRRPQMGFSSR